MIYLYFAIVFYAGVFLGAILQRWLGRRKVYDGIINITRTPDKTLFSLELHDDPEMLVDVPAVLFKVVTEEEKPEEEPHRE